MFRVKGWWAEPNGYEVNKDYDKELQGLKDYFAEAKSYYEEATHAKTRQLFSPTANHAIT